MSGSSVNTQTVKVHAPTLMLVTKTQTVKLCLKCLKLLSMWHWQHLVWPVAVNYEKCECSSSIAWLHWWLKHLNRNATKMSFSDILCLYFWTTVSKISTKPNLKPTSYVGNSRFVLISYTEHIISLIIKFKLFPIFFVNISKVVYIMWNLHTKLKHMFDFVNLYN